MSWVPGSVKLPVTVAVPFSLIVAEVGAAQTAAGPRFWTVTLPDEPARHYTVEIRDPAQGHKLITLIEILSPSNKRPGPDRTAYISKQREVLDSDANLVEIDLLRSGRRPLPTSLLEMGVAQLSPRPDYLVLVSPAWRRSGPMLGYIAYPFSLREWLPCIGVPLKPDRDQAWRDFAGWRVNYDVALVALARLTMAPMAPWSSDRYEDVHFVPPAFPWLRRGGQRSRGHGSRREGSHE